MKKVILRMRCWYLRLLSRYRFKKLKALDQKVKHSTFYKIKGVEGYPISKRDEGIKKLKEERYRYSYKFYNTIVRYRVFRYYSKASGKQTPPVTSPRR